MINWQTHWRAWLIISLTSIFSSILLWLPFVMGLDSFWGIPLPPHGMGVIISNYDTPYYMVVSQSWYQPETIAKNFEFDLPLEYYPAHFPLFPFLGYLLKPIITLPYGLLSASLLFTILTTIMIYYLSLRLYSDKPALVIALISLFLPGRWLIVRSLASPEPVFIFFTLMALWSYLNRQFWRTGIWGALAQLTKPPGGLLFVALAIHQLYLHRKHWHQPVKLIQSLWSPLLALSLIPVALGGLFAFFAQQTGDFWAYFHSGDNIHLFWPPFQMFSKAAFWVGTVWLEDIVWLLLITAVGISLWWQKGKRFSAIACYVTVFWLSLIFVSHRDLSRYALPIMPLVWLVYAPYLIKKKFLWLVVLLIPLYLYALNFIAYNTVGISNWQPLIR